MANYQPYDKKHRELQEDVRPPNSRLFILCSRSSTEDQFQREFERFGTIEDIWVVKDKRTNENKGDFCHFLEKYFITTDMSGFNDDIIILIVMFAVVF